MKRKIMNLDDCILTSFALIDEMMPPVMKGKRLFMHTIGVLFNSQDQAPPLQLDRLVA
jgi:hypothetical protein